MTPPMSDVPSDGEAPEAKLARLSAQLDSRIEHLAESRTFGKGSQVSPLLDLARRLMLLPGGMDAVYQRIQRIEQAGLFWGSDWAEPESLQPRLTMQTLRSGPHDGVVMECLNQIRLLAVAQGAYRHEAVDAQRAWDYLCRVLALNIDLLFDQGNEAQRVRGDKLGPLLARQLQFLIERIGYADILEALVEEAWRVMAQRPVRVDAVKAMVTQIAVYSQDEAIAARLSGSGADQLIAALFGPTPACRDDPGLEVYRQRLAGLGAEDLESEAGGFARAMHDTGLVSVYHTVLLSHLRGGREDLFPVALGLSSTGRESLLCFSELVHALIDRAIVAETAQGIYGLAWLLERGILFQPPVAPALWRQVFLTLSPQAEHAIALACGAACPARVQLLAGVLCVLGQPLGLGQGNNPTCQSARAISMWSYNDPDYLLQMVAWAARDDEVVMSFESHHISSRQLAAGLAQQPPTDVDALSAVLVPHLDRVYIEMGRLCQGRGDDPHRWINPEFHGWWVGRGMRLAVDLSTGALSDYHGFVRHFYGSYHPYYNGQQPLIHPQPAGLAVTDSIARFVGWHAITILRVALDPQGTMRVYFFNPNNDSAQDFGDDVLVSTYGHGEIHGESSLPVAQFASRLYLFHFDPLERAYPEQVPTEEIEAVEAMARSSWAAKR